jgi:hypothetical protein
VERRNDEVRNPRLFDTHIGEKSPPRLLDGSEPRRLVVTEAMIPGQRDSTDLRLVVPAPVDYEPREFIIHLFSQLCGAVPHGPADRSAIATETRRHLEQLRYLRMYTASWSRSLTARSVLVLTRWYAKERADQPAMLPELVDSFRNYSARMASWQRSAHRGGGRVVIGRIHPYRRRDRGRPVLRQPVLRQSR